MGRRALLHILGSPGDPHIRGVTAELLTRGVTCLVYSPVADEEGTRLPSVRLTDASGIAVSVEPKDWWWLRSKHRTIRYRSADDQRRSFEATTRRDVALSLIANRGCRCFNNEWRGLPDKLTQLDIARSLGFAVPDTLVSCDKAQIIAFIQASGRTIVKPFSMSFAPAYGSDDATLISIMANVVTVAEISAASDEQVASFPAIYQACIEKSHELRVVGFGDACLGFKINSQASPRSVIDWRRAERLAGIVGREPVPLPPEMQYFTSAFLRRSHLHSGVFDFAVTPNGKTVFFECNPSGQWADLDGRHGSVTRLFADGFESLLSS